MAVFVLAADGAVTITATNSGSGFNIGHYQLNASGHADSANNRSGEGYSSHSESHDTWSQTDSRNSDSSWQENFTTGSASGSSNATGSADNAIWPRADCGTRSRNS